MKLIWLANTAEIQQCRMGVSVEEWRKLSPVQDMDLQNLHAKPMASFATCMKDQ